MITSEVFQLFRGYKEENGGNMHRCTDIVGSFYDDLEKEDYRQYIGQSINTVIEKLNRTHIVIPYRIDDLKNRDGIIWKSKGDSRAHIGIYNDKRP